MEILPIIYITLTVLGFMLVTALNLKLLIWLTNFILGPGIEMPGILKTSGILLLMHVIVTAIYLGTTVVIRSLLPATPNSWEQANGFGSLIYFPLGYLATTCILWKLLPASFLRSMLIAAVHICFMFLLGGALFLFVIVAAYSQYNRT